MFDYSTLTPEAMANMSDEEFAKLDPSKIPQVEVSEPTEEEPTPPVETAPQEEVQVPPVEVEDTTPPPVEEAVDEVTPSEPANEGDDVVPPADETQQPAPTTQPETEDATQPDTPAEVSQEKAFFDAVTAGFQANGKEYKVDNAADAVKLMQMGLNYNQKMAAMKPNLKIVRALQDAGITSVEQLGHLLDLHAKKPEAIAKLVQDSGLDTYEFEEQAKTYVPTAPSVSDQTIEFEMVANELGSNPHFNTVVSHLGNFDNQTKQQIFENPDMLRTLTDHVQHGFYDKIIAQMDLGNALGHYRGMTFLQAYEQTGQQLFGQQQQQQPVVNQVPTPVPVPVPVATKPNPVNNTARQAAASVTNTATSTHKPQPTAKELWEMSDEEFAKIDPKFLK